MLTFDPAMSRRPSQRIDRVVLIGPVFPFRGGIAQHTTMLHRVISESSQCLTISFKRQYPRLLFSGRSDKDESQRGYCEPGVEYVIDSLNPLTWNHAVKIVRAFRPSVVVFPWWHVYWTPCFTWLARQLRRSNIEVVYLCHNVIPHEVGFWTRTLCRIALSAASRYVVHTQTDKKDVLSFFPDARVSVHPLPVFSHFPQPEVFLPRRGQLELLFFGFVRPYKGLDVLLEAFRLLKDESVFLSIVGELWCDSDQVFQYIKNYGLEHKIEVVGRYVADIEAASYFARCDVVVLPYRNATGSAVIPLSYHYGKPVIATRVGGLPEAVVERVTGILVDPGSSEQLAEAVRCFLCGQVQINHMAIDDMRKRFSWEGLVSVVLGDEEEIYGRE